MLTEVLAEAQCYFSRVTQKVAMAIWKMHRMKKVQDEDRGWGEGGGGDSKISLQGYASFDAVAVAPGRQEKVYYCLSPSGDVAVNTHP